MHGVGSRVAITKFSHQPLLPTAVLKWMPTYRACVPRPNTHLYYQNTTST